MQRNKKFLKVNPPMLVDAGDYLIANGFEEHIGSAGKIIFVKDDMHIFIENDCASFLIYQMEDTGQRSAHYDTFQSHTGISNFNLFDWMLVFHITRAVPLKKFIQKAKQDLRDPNELLDQVYNHFLKPELPTCY